MSHSPLNPSLSLPPLTINQNPSLIMHHPPSQQPHQESSHSPFLFLFLLPKKPKNPLTLYFLLFLSLLFLSFFLFLSPSSSSTHPSSNPRSSSRSHLSSQNPSARSLPSPPSLAYLLTASAGDSRRIIRLLLSVYHPRNIYLLHLDLIATHQERESLARKVRLVPAFRSAGNVHVVGKADFAYKGGSSALAAMLHGAAVLLRIGENWDWFLNLDVNDYPLVTQDDLLHVFSFLPRDLNFVQHSNYLGWRESRKLKPIIVDPGLYLSNKAGMFYATQKRDLPDAFRLFTGSPSVMLSRRFVEHCILGTDNLPRILLMYYANTPASNTAYFQTLLCNSPEFNRTIINDHLHHVKWDTPTKREPRALYIDDFDNMTHSNAAFATGFPKDSAAAVLDRIDREILDRDPGDAVPGGWCLGQGNEGRCSTWGPTDVLRPGPGATRLAKSIVQMLADGSYRSNRCIWDGST